MWPIPWPAGPLDPRSGCRTALNPSYVSSRSGRAAPVLAGSAAAPRVVRHSEGGPCRAGQARCRGRHLGDHAEHRRAASASAAYKSATVMFGQSLDRAVLSRAVRAAAGADLMLAVGSTLTSSPPLRSAR